MTGIVATELGNVLPPYTLHDDISVSQQAQNLDLLSRPVYKS